MSTVYVYWSMKTVSMSKLSNPSVFLIIILLSLAFFSCTSYGTRDVELRKCMQSCQEIQVPAQRICKLKCVEGTKYISHGAVDSSERNPQSPDERYQACQQHCERTEIQHRPECRQKCVDEYKKERHDDDSPHLFKENHFTKNGYQRGRLRILHRFLDHSRRLSAISSFCFGLLEVDTHAFIIPSRLDVDLLNVVLQGQGSVTLIRSEGRENTDLQLGDIYKVPAGTTAYLNNTQKNEKLEIASLILLVSTPGKYKQVKRERLGQKNEGLFVKASEEQIRALSDLDICKGLWPFGESNKYGEIHDFKPDDFKPFQDLNVGVSITNITKGTMSTMFFNSKSMKTCIVLNGEGYIQMACPHLSSSSSEKSEQGHGSGCYEQVNTQLRHGGVFIAPPGHPFIIRASSNQNLKLLCFVINARNNERTPLAGGNNIWNQLKEVAKDLTFEKPSQAIDHILKSQTDKWYMKRPHP